MGLEKLSDDLRTWINNNENQKINKMIVLFTFFIALGEISNIVKNYIEISNKVLYVELSVIILVALFILFTIIYITHEKRLKRSINQTFKAGTILSNEA